MRVVVPASISNGIFFWNWQLPCQTRLYSQWTDKSRLSPFSNKWSIGSLCHHCNKNKLNKKDRHFLPNGIEVCKESAERHSASEFAPQVRSAGTLA